MKTELKFYVCVFALSSGSSILNVLEFLDAPARDFFEECIAVVQS